MFTKQNTVTLYSHSDYYIRFAKIIPHPRSKGPRQESGDVFGGIPYSEVQAGVGIPYHFCKIEVSPYQFRSCTQVFDVNPYRFRLRTMISNLIRTRTVSVLTF